MNNKEDDYNINPRCCLNCDKVLEYNKRKNKFCSSSCSAIFNNKHRKINKKTECLNCGEEVKKNNNKFCSCKCNEEFKFKKYIQYWKNNDFNSESGKFDISKYIKKYLFIKFDSKCAKCGWSIKNEFTNRIPLEVEHIDGNSENNKEVNLTLLCPNCHSLTETYKGANRGNGRYKRRQRYKDNKSY